MGDAWFWLTNRWPLRWASGRFYLMDIPPDMEITLTPQRKHWSCDPQPTDGYIVNVVRYREVGNSHTRFYHKAINWEEAIACLIELLIAEPSLF